MKIGDLIDTLHVAEKACWEAEQKSRAAEAELTAARDEVARLSGEVADKIRGSTFIHKGLAYSASQDFRRYVQSCPVLVEPEGP
jgi:hypothetical protein